jgi:ribonuclease HI
MSSGPASGYSSGMTEVVIYTDGACSGNPGRGGWGAVLRWNGTQKELHGGEPLTTNNRMELMAAIQALEALNRPSQVTLHTDSKYLLDGITKWSAGWQRNGWLTSAKKPVKNEDLWRRLIAALDGHEVSWQWVRGHAGDEGNEQADALARLGAEEAGSAVRSAGLPRGARVTVRRGSRTAGRRSRPGPGPRRRR